MRESADRIDFYAKWRSGEIDGGTDPGELDEIPDAEDLKYLHVGAKYGAGQNLDLTVSTTGTEIKWQGSEAADKARRIAYKWAGLPGRAPLNFPQAFTLIFLYMLIYFVTCAYSEFNASISVIVVGILGWAITVMAICKSGPFTIFRIMSRPVIRSRKRSTFNEPTFYIPLTISLLALAFGGISGITDLITFMNK